MSQRCGLELKKAPYWQDAAEIADQQARGAETLPEAAYRAFAMS